MSDITRRSALQGIGIGLGIGLTGAGCGIGTDGVATATSPTAPPPTLSQGPAPTPQDAPPSAGPPAPATDPLTPKQLLAGIDHIVVLMMENRSFDHFLGALKSDSGYAGAAQVEGLTGSESNPSPDGGPPVTVFKMANFTPEDPPHSWDAAHDQFNNGANDGFVAAHAGASQNEVMGFHDRSQIPLYYWFADNFAICDHWYASVMGPTWPNRFHLHATTSAGKKDNKPLLTGAPDTIWDALEDKGLSCKNYAGGSVAWFLGGFPSKVLQGMNPTAPIDDFFEAAKAGTLPAFSLIDPDFAASDDHPAHNIQRGQAFVASVYKALAESPAWPKTLLIVTYDEHGGFFDHVAPPKTDDTDPDFEQLGFRVPAFVIGATVKKGYVCKTQLEHSSVAATLQTRWDIRTLTKRMLATKDISDCIDPKKVELPDVPPLGMPQVAMTMETALYDGVGPSSQPMLEKLVAEGVVQRRDTRTDQERIAAWLRHAVGLGAVRIVGG